MDYQKIKLNNGIELFLDADARRKTCDRCGKMVSFGQDATGKWICLDKAGGTWQKHIGCQNKHKKLDAEKQIDDEEKNQEYLNNL
jgi:hypothetical protein